MVRGDIARSETPLVSIVMTSFNYERYVGEAIESALAQTYRNVEVIVVDDGSVDNSRAVIATYEPRVQTILQPNLGQTAACNAGFAAARGDFVIFLDSDDMLVPDAVRRALDAVRIGVCCVQYRLRIIDADGRLSESVFPSIPPGRTPEQVRSEALKTGLYEISPTSGCFYGRELLEKVFPISASEFTHGVDAPINVVAPLYGDVVTLDEVLGFYRIHGRNQWAQNNLDVTKFPLYVAGDLQRVAYFRQHAEALGIPLPPYLLERSLAHLQFRMASFKVDRSNHPVSNDTSRGLLGCAITAAAATTGRRGFTMLVLVWMALMSIAPRPFALRLVAFRFLGQSRSRRLNGLLRFFRLLPMHRLVGAK